MTQTGRGVEMTGPSFRNPEVLSWGPSPEWMDSAQCRDDATPDVFFDKNTAVAQATCARCPVMDMCRRFALENGLDSGFWGGLSEDERKAIRSHPKRPRPGFARGAAP